MLSRVFYLFPASIPVIVVYKLYDDPRVKQTCVSFSISLKMITAVNFIWPFWLIIVDHLFQSKSMTIHKTTVSN
jgi:hypothetical protein